MKRCHSCGKDFHENAGVVRAVKTGAYTGGGDYFRDVNLCRQCDQNQTSEERSQHIHKRLVLLGGVVAVAVGAVYMLFLR